MALVLLAVTLGLSSCMVVPLRARTMTRGAAAPELDHRGKIDLSFLRTGETTADEVRDKLGFVDTGVRAPNLFVGRWMTSRWMILWGIAGGYSADGGAERTWGLSNLVLTFDEHQKLRTFRIGSERELHAELQKWAGEDVRRNPWPETSLEVRSFRVGGWSMAKPISLQMARDSLRYTEIRKKNDRIVEFAPTDLLELEPKGAIQGPSDRLSSIYARLRFAKRKDAPREIVLQLQMNQFVELLRYAEHARALRQAEAVQRK